MSISSLNWIYDQYDKITDKYSGKYVIITETEIVFADENFDIVFSKYKSMKDTTRCKMVLIDDAEATLYATKVPSGKY